MRLTIVPFSHDMVEQAGAMLAQRHAADRAALPLLPVRFEHTAASTAAVAAVLARPHASGVAAMIGGRMLGYLIGDMVFDTTWGRAAWVRGAGHALAPGQSTELMRNMYATLARRWVRYGCYTHIALVSTANAPLLDAWFRLSFGVEQMHALLDLATVDLLSADPRFTIRQAGADDGPIMASFAGEIWQQQVAAPTWAFTAPERADELPQLYADEVDDAEGVTWLAFDAGRPVGFQSFYPYSEGEDTLYVPPGCAELATAATTAESRGRGVGTALTRHGLAWAVSQGYRVVATDWRSTNLQSSRFGQRIKHLLGDQGLRQHRGLLMRIDHARVHQHDKISAAKHRRPNPKRADLAAGGERSGDGIQQKGDRQCEHD
ncbi:MAG: GNAT family N-acetyltransferase, partial [Roseiflexaceae bacterium]|nr:GNAT family N-acetyltransferase [Roseiflexaceae bacterium]